MPEASPRRPKVVVALPLPENLLQRLEHCDVAYLAAGCLAADEFMSALSGADGLVVSSNVIVDRHVIASAGRLRVISTMSAGLDHIDLAAARDAGVTVTNAPVLWDAVADLTMALIVMLARRIPEALKVVESGGWSAELPHGSDVSGKTLLIVGFGRIGRAVAVRALAAGMGVRFVDAREDLVPADGTERVRDLAAGLEMADFVSLHVDLNPGTRDLIGKEQLAVMKPTAFLINTSRGGVVDQAALIDALRSGAIAGAGLDVLAVEPPSRDDPVFGAPNVVILPHIGSATTETRYAMAACAVDNLVRVLRNEDCDYVVT